MCAATRDRNGSDDRSGRDRPPRDRSAPPSDGGGYSGDETVMMPRRPRPSRGRPKSTQPAGDDAVSDATVVVSRPSRAGSGASAPSWVPPRKSTPQAKDARAVLEGLGAERDGGPRHASSSRSSSSASAGSARSSAKRSWLGRGPRRQATGSGIPTPWFRYAVWGIGVLLLGASVGTVAWNVVQVGGQPDFRTRSDFSGGGDGAAIPSSAPAAPAAGGGLSVWVEDPRGAPLAGVGVSVEPGQVAGTTDARGAFLVDWLSPGSYELTVSRLGFESEVSPVTLPRLGGRINKIVTLRPTASRVVTASGAAGAERSSAPVVNRAGSGRRTSRSRDADATTPSRALPPVSANSDRSPLVVQAAASSAATVVTEPTRQVQGDPIPFMVRAVDEDDAPLSGVEITLNPGDRTEVTNERGEWLFGELPPATYRLTGTLTGYQPKDVDVPVESDGETVYYTVTLVAFPSAPELIQKTVEDYCAAYADLDTDGVQSVFPVISEERVRGLQRNFEGAASIEYGCTLLEIKPLDIDAGAATAEVEIVQVRTPKAGKVQETEIDGTFFMRRQDDGQAWLIADVRTRLK